jgi:uncharacterized membrane protein
MIELMIRLMIIHGKKLIFWWRWLVAAAGAVLAFGLLLVVLSISFCPQEINGHIRINDNGRHSCVPFPISSR